MTIVIILLLLLSTNHASKIFQSCYIQSFTPRQPERDLRVGFLGVFSLGDMVFGNPPILSFRKGCRISLSEGHCWIIRPESPNRPLASQPIIFVPGNMSRAVVKPGDRLVLFRSKSCNQDDAREEIACFLQERQLMPELFPGRCPRPRHDNAYMMLVVGGPPSDV